MKEIINEEFWLSFWDNVVVKVSSYIFDKYWIEAKSIYDWKSEFQPIENY